MLMSHRIKSGRCSCAILIPVTPSSAIKVCNPKRLSVSPMIIRISGLSSMASTLFCFLPNAEVFSGNPSGFVLIPATMRLP